MTFPCFWSEFDFSYQSKCPYFQNPRPNRYVLDTAVSFEARILGNHFYIAMDTWRAASDASRRDYYCNAPEEQELPDNDPARYPCLRIPQACRLYFHRCPCDEISVVVHLHFKL